MKSAFEIFKGKNGLFYFRLKAPNHEIILQSQGYERRANAATGIESVKRNKDRSKAFEIYQAKNRQWFFILKARNGRVIGVSETYTSKAMCFNGIESVRRNAL